MQDLVCNNFGAVTYVRLNSVVEARCTTLFENDTFTTESSSSSSSSSSSESDTTCVKGVMKKWRDFNVSMSSVRSIFLYLDRSYIINNTESAIASALVEQQLSLPLSLPLPPHPNNSNKNSALATIWQMGLNSFKSVLISRNITELLVKWTNSCIKLERETSTDSVKKIDRELLREVTEMLRSLGIYKEKFEEDFITSSAEFFKSEGSNCLSTVDLATYLSRCEMRLNQAADQVAAYLDPKTRKPLVQSIENNFLRPHVKSILDSGEEEGFSLLMNGGKHDDLKRLRTLLSRVNGTEVSYNTIILEKNVTYSILCVFIKMVDTIVTVASRGHSRLRANQGEQARARRGSKGGREHKQRRQNQRSADERRGQGGEENTAHTYNSPNLTLFLFLWCR